MQGFGHILGLFPSVWQVLAKLAGYRPVFQGERNIIQGRLYSRDFFMNLDPGLKFKKPEKQEQGPELVRVAGRI